jgi:CRP-like cAMP-binding protein
MNSPYHRLEEFVSPTELEKSKLQRHFGEPRKIGRGQSIRKEGDRVEGIFFLLEGWVASSILLRDGKRQIVKIHLPGDLLGCPSLALKESGETLEALTDAVISPIPNCAIGQIFKEVPRLAVGLFLSAQKERVALMQALAWVGASQAVERLAALLIDLHHRLLVVDQVFGGAFEFPLTQFQVGEILGLTYVHVNRTFRKLDELGCITRGKGRIEITDQARLRSLAASPQPSFAGAFAWERLGKPFAV